MKIGILSNGLRYISILVLESFSGCKFRKKKNKNFLLYSCIFNTVATESGGTPVNICITKSIFVHGPVYLNTKNSAIIFQLKQLNYPFLEGDRVNNLKQET